MRVEIFAANDARELTRELNAVLEGYNNEKENENGRNNQV